MLWSVYVKVWCTLSLRILSLRRVMAFTLNSVYVSTERSGGHVDHFDIVERVEMGQMASMFFNKGNYSSGLELLISLPIIQLTADATFISHV